MIDDLVTANADDTVTGGSVTGIISTPVIADCPGDLNGDGTADLAVAIGSRITTHLGDPAGGFTRGPDFEIASVARSLAAADLSGSPPTAASPSRNS